MRRTVRLTSGLAVAGLITLAGTGISDAASDSAANAVKAPISSTNCPTAGNFGNGTPSSADQAFSAISPTAGPSTPNSTQLAFTGANLPKEGAAGLILIGLGGVAVQRTRRRHGAEGDLASVEGAVED